MYSLCCDQIRDPMENCSILLISGYEDQHMIAAMVCRSVLVNILEQFGRFGLQPIYSVSTATCGS
uniref:Uncharacterized protein n=1 Tax=Arundo donax TaxID=35708 RepID=A0A0A9GLQ1_ARUDO